MHRPPVSVTTTVETMCRRTVWAPPEAAVMAARTSPAVAVSPPRIAGRTAKAKTAAAAATAAAASRRRGREAPAARRDGRDRGSVAVRGAGPRARRGSPAGAAGRPRWPGAARRAAGRAGRRGGAVIAAPPRGRLGSQRAPHGGARQREARGDGPDRDLERLGDRAVVVALAVDEEEDGALLDGQAAERRADLLAQGEAADVVGGVGELVGELLAGRPDLLPAQVVEADAVADLVQPGAERGVAAEPRQAGPGLHEGVLQGVVHLVGVAQQVVGEHAQPALVVVDDLVEGAVVAALRAAQDGAVDLAGAAVAARPAAGPARWSPLSSSTICPTSSLHSRPRPAPRGSHGVDSSRGVPRRDPYRLSLHAPSPSAVTLSLALDAGTAPSFNRAVVIVDRA